MLLLARLVAMYNCIKMLPQEILEIRCSDLRPFWDRSRAVVVTWLAEYRIQLLAVHMHLLSQLTSNFHERRYYGCKNSRWDDITRRTRTLKCLIYLRMYIVIVIVIVIEHSNKMSR